MGSLHHIHDHPEYRCYFDPPDTEPMNEEQEREISASLARLEKEPDRSENNLIISNQGPEVCYLCKHQEDIRPRWKQLLFQPRDQHLECKALRTKNHRLCIEFNSEGRCPFFRIALGEK